MKSLADPEGETMQPWLSLRHAKEAYPVSASFDRLWLEEANLNYRLPLPLHFECMYVALMCGKVRRSAPLVPWSSRLFAGGPIVLRIASGCPVGRVD